MRAKTRRPLHTRIHLAEVTIASHNGEQKRFGFHFNGTLHEQFVFPWHAWSYRQNFLQGAEKLIHTTSPIRGTDVSVLGKLAAMADHVGEDTADGRVYVEMFDAITELHDLPQTDSLELRKNIVNLLGMA